MNDNILGLDLSLSETGWYSLCTNQGNIIKTDSKYQTDVRIERIRRNIYDVIYDFYPQFVAIEEVIRCPNADTTIKLAKLHGVIINMLIRKGYKIAPEEGVDAKDDKKYILQIHNMTLKKWATGKGNATKEEMIKACLKYDKTFSNNNIADAFLVAKYFSY